MYLMNVRILYPYIEKREGSLVCLCVRLAFLLLSFFFFFFFFFSVSGGVGAGVLGDFDLLGEGEGRKGGEVKWGRDKYRALQG